jgi:hypothetical protein
VKNVKPVNQCEPKTCEPPTTCPTTKAPITNEPTSESLTTTTENVITTTPATTEKIETSTEPPQFLEMKISYETLYWAVHLLKLRLVWSKKTKSFGVVE